MSELLLQLVKSLAEAMTSKLSAEQVKSVIDKAFDAVEDKVTGSSTHWDDVIILPILTALRNALDVPDNDDPDDYPKPVIES